MGNGILFSVGNVHNGRFTVNAYGWWIWGVLEDVLNNIWLWNINILVVC